MFEQILRVIVRPIDKSDRIYSENMTDFFHWIEFTVQIMTDLFLWIEFTVQI